MESYLVFCLNFVIFEAFFSIVFRIDFWTHFLTKNMSKLTSNDVAFDLLFLTFFEVVFFHSTLGQGVSVQGRIVVRGDRRHLEILAVEAIIFIHETGGHWHKQVSLRCMRIDWLA